MLGARYAGRSLRSCASRCSPARPIAGSNHPPSDESGGYFGFVLPFFSDTFLPAEEGLHDEIADYRLTHANTTNGRSPTFHCVRTSSNGLHIQQLCDPGSSGDGTGRMTGAVRAHVEAFWNGLCVAVSIFRAPLRIFQTPCCLASRACPARMPPLANPEAPDES